MATADDVPDMSRRPCNEAQSPVHSRAASPVSLPPKVAGTVLCRPANARSELEGKRKALSAGHENLFTIRPGERVDDSAIDTDTTYAGDHLYSTNSPNSLRRQANRTGHIEDSEEEATLLGIPDQPPALKLDQLTTIHTAPASAPAPVVPPHSTASIPCRGNEAPTYHSLLADLDVLRCQVESGEELVSPQARNVLLQDIGSQRHLLVTMGPDHAELDLSGVWREIQKLMSMASGPLLPPPPPSAMD